MNCSRIATALFALFLSLSCSAADDKERVIVVSWGDIIGKGEETPEALAELMAKMENMPALDGIVVDGRPYSVVAPQ